MVIPKTDRMLLVGILWKMPKAMDEAIVSETKGPRAQVKEVYLWGPSSLAVAIATLKLRSAESPQEN